MAHSVGSLWRARLEEQLDAQTGWGAAASEAGLGGSPDRGSWKFPWPAYLASRRAHPSAGSNRMAFWVAVQTIVQPQAGRNNHAAATLLRKHKAQPIGPASPI